jgi:hypothetical protein
MVGRQAFEDEPEEEEEKSSQKRAKLKDSTAKKRTKVAELTE